MHKMVQFPKAFPFKLLPIHQTIGEGVSLKVNMLDHLGSSMDTSIYTLHSALLVGCKNLVTKAKVWNSIVRV